MVRGATFVALLLLLTAGCASKPQDNLAPATSSETFVVTAAPTIDATPRTDTLHLLAPPHMAGSLADGGTLVRSPIPSDDMPQDSPYPTWSMTRPPLAILNATAHIWVHVDGLITNPNAAASSAAQCFWGLELRFEGGVTGTGSGRTETLANGCVTEPAVVPTGTREIVFQLPPADLSNREGTRIQFSLYNVGIYGPDGVVEALSGTAQYDSTLHIDGLQLPLDILTLLQ